MMDGALSISRIARPERVRVAGPQDRERLWEALMLAADDNALYPVSEHKVREALEKMIYRRDAVAGVIDGSTALAGIAALTYAQVWYSNAWHIEDLAVFVHPDYRRGSQNKGHAQALLDFLVWWGDQMGLPVHPGVLSVKRTRGKMKLYERKFGPQVGAVFMHNPMSRVA